MQGEARWMTKEDAHWGLGPPNSSGHEYCEVAVQPSPASPPASIADLDIERNGFRRGEMVRNLCGIADFIRRIRMRAPFGSLSRAPLILLRFEVCGSAAECDWLARPPDEWDSNMPKIVGEQNASRQALEDAVGLRRVLFRLVPSLESTILRVYRKARGESLELIIRGQVHRTDHVSPTVRSLTMRAKLYGLQFWMEEGVLGPLHIDRLGVRGTRLSQEGLHE